MRLISLLNAETGAPVSALRRIIATAPKRYKEYDIPKRSGGTRRIAHPAKELKELQRVILHEVLDKCPVSPVASAYVKGRGILYNAQIHCEQKWILKLDFKDFFHSLTPADWDRVVDRTECLSSFSSDMEDFNKILFWGRKTVDPKCLSIGAPTSPSVSNILCHKLDEWLAARAVDSDLKVSRYADDITVSGSEPARLLRFERDLAKVLESNKGLRLTLNPKKRGLYGPGDRRMVTGLIITPNGDISIGRDRKREIHSLVHKFKMQSLDFGSVMRTKGLLAFCHSVEPNFVQTLREKYGQDVVSAIQSTFQDPDPEYLTVAFI